MDNYTNQELRDFVKKSTGKPVDSIAEKDRKFLLEALTGLTKVDAQRNLRDATGATVLDQKLIPYHNFAINNGVTDVNSSNALAASGVLQNMLPKKVIPVGGGVQKGKGKDPAKDDQSDSDDGGDGGDGGGDGGGGGNGDGGKKRNDKSWLNNKDLNGECFISGELGEVEEFLTTRAIWFLKDSPRAKVPFEDVDFDAKQAEDFINVNVQMLAEINERHKKGLTDSEIAKIAWIRFLVARNGLASPEFKTDKYFVKYNEAVEFDTNIRGLPKDRINFKPVLTEELRDYHRKNFANMVCIVAYFFRVRGHHWLPEMDTDYMKVWKKAQKGEENPGIKWGLVAHEALHAIFPSILDEYWTKRVETGSVHGALSVRYDSAPAGVAAVRTVYAGVQDLRVAVPYIVDMFAADVKYLEGVVANLRANRWDGSINRNYYGAKKVVFDESRFAGLAATVLAAISSLVANSPLKDAPSLKRIALGAAITGAILARSMSTLTSDPEMIKSHLLTQGKVLAAT